MLIAFAAIGGTPRAAEIRFEHNETLGSVVLSLNGPIIRGDLFKTTEALKDSRVRPGLLLTLNSPGGVQNEALLMAYQLRRKRVSTVLLPGAFCASACALLFFGGVDEAGKPRRIAFRGSRLGVHRPSPNPNRPPDAVQAQRLLNGLQKYMQEVGVSDDVQKKVFETDPAALYLLNETELISNNVTMRGDAPLIPPLTGTIRANPHSINRTPRPARPLDPKNPLGPRSNPWDL